MQPRPMSRATSSRPPQSPTWPAWSCLPAALGEGGLQLPTTQHLRRALWTTISTQGTLPQQHRSWAQHRSIVPVTHSVPTSTSTTPTTRRPPQLPTMGACTRPLTPPVQPRRRPLTPRFIRLVQPRCTRRVTKQRARGGINRRGP